MTWRPGWTRSARVACPTISASSVSATTTAICGALTRCLTGTAGRVPRHQRGLWLSAARSQIFNEVLAERVRREDWDRPQPGDCLQLDGCHSHFVAEQIDDELSARAERLDLHPSGPLWGKGDAAHAGGHSRAGAVGRAGFAPWDDRLAELGLEQERRALRLPVRELEAEYSDGLLKLEFELPAGAYATAVLRELIDWS